eukprot:s977_g4.t2
MSSQPDVAVLRDILLRQIRHSQLLKYDIEVFDRASEKSHEKSYECLHQSMRSLVDRERLRENRNQIAEKNKAGGPAKGDGRTSRKGTPDKDRGMLRDVNAQNCSPAEHPISLITANGSTEANEVADVKLSALPDPVQPYVLDQNPVVLSVGTRCVDQGYSFVWPANCEPILVRPDDNVVQLNVEGHVPVLDETRKAFSKDEFQKDKHLRKLFAMPTSSSSPAPKLDLDELDELMPDLDSVEHARSRRQCITLVTKVWRRVSSIEHSVRSQSALPEQPKACRRHTSGKLSPASNEGLFLGYHIQPSHDWKGEYLVATPLKAEIDAKAPKPDRLEDQVIPPSLSVVPLESALQMPADDPLEYEPGTPIDAASDGVPEVSEEPIFSDIKLTPKGDVIPDGHHWDGHSIVARLQKATWDRCGDVESAGIQ